MFFAAASRATRPLATIPRVNAFRSLATAASNAPTSKYDMKPDADGKYTVTLFSGDGA